MKVARACFGTNSLFTLHERVIVDSLSYELGSRLESVEILVGSLARS